MNLSTITSLIGAMAGSGLAEMTYSEGGWTLRLVRHAAAAPAPRPAPAAEAHGPAPTGVVEAPLAGVVHFRPAPDAPPFVAPGGEVRPGDALCIIEAMKVFNTIRAERGGVVAEILAASGAEVDAGQPLLRLA